MNVEDRVRAAAHARTALIRDVRPLDLPAVPSRAPRPRRWVSWAAPVAAATAVVTLAVSLVVVRHMADAPVAPAAVPAASGALPEFYAALDSPSGPLTQIGTGQRQSPVSVRVGDDRTGKLVATVRPPSGETFAGLTAAANDRMFVVAAERFPVQPVYPSVNPVAWYLLRLTPGSVHPVALTRLPIPGEPKGTQISAIALAPDGSELAVMDQQNVWSGKTGPLTVSLYSLATGLSVRTWTVDTKGFPAGFGWYWSRYSNTALTWLDGGRTLAVTDGISTSASGPPFTYGFSQVSIRTVNADSPSGNLLARSRIVFRLPDNTGCDTVQLTGDGQTVLCGEEGGNTAKRSSAYAPKFLAYSVATGKSRLLYQLKGAYETGLADVLWASPTGSVLLGTVYAETTWPRPGAPQRPIDLAVGLLTKGIFTPVRFPLTAIPFAGEIAF
jgi:energy-converting hydrogenase Eha subunit A